MKSESYQQMHDEASNWLKLGRLELLRAVLRRHAPKHDRLRILEIGAGVGQNVAVLREFGVVDVLEVNALGLSALRQTDGIRRVLDVPVPSPIDSDYDVIVAMDVLEHLADDSAATSWVASLLVEGGVFIATVPAYQWMFSDHDRALEHYRRYTRSTLVKALPAELPAVQSGYFVSLLLPAAVALRVVHALSTRLRGLRRGRGDARRKQSALVPGPIDRVFRAELGLEVAAIRRGITLPFGLSVFAIARKRA